MINNTTSQSKKNQFLSFLTIFCLFNFSIQSAEENIVEQSAEKNIVEYANENAHNIITTTISNKNTDSVLSLDKIDLIITKEQAACIIREAKIPYEDVINYQINEQENKIDHELSKGEKFESVIQDTGNGSGEINIYETELGQSALNKSINEIYKQPKLNEEIKLINHSDNEEVKSEEVKSEEVKSEEYKPELNEEFVKTNVHEINPCFTQRKHSESNSNQLETISKRVPSATFNEIEDPQIVIAPLKQQIQYLESENNEEHSVDSGNQKSSKKEVEYKYEEHNESLHKSNASNKSKKLDHSSNHENNIYETELGQSALNKSINEIYKQPKLNEKIKLINHSDSEEVKRKRTYSGEDVIHTEFRQYFPIEEYQGKPVESFPPKTEEPMIKTIEQILLTKNKDLQNQIEILNKESKLSWGTKILCILLGAVITIIISSIISTIYILVSKKSMKNKHNITESEEQEYITDTETESIQEQEVVEVN